jgi:uroporphyrinogen decarboxylase
VTTAPTSRERVIAALDRREPDRVPRDLGGTRFSSIHVQAYRALRPALGLPEREPVVADLSQQLALVEDDVMDALGADVRGIGPRAPSAWRAEPVVEGRLESFRDEWGVVRSRPLDGGLYFDATGAPLAGDIGESELSAFAWPDPTDPARYAGMAAAARRYAREERRAVYVGSVCAGITETYLRLRGYEDGYMDLVARPALAQRVMERILEIKLGYWERALAELGDDVDVVGEADDLGGQQAPLFSPETYRALVKPLHARLFGFLRSRSRARVFLHSCGAIRPLIPDLIDIGVQVLNPVQVSAPGMDSAELKREFGRDLAFWGGAADSQGVLGRGSVEEVRAEVRRRVDDLMPGGGFVFASVHNIQANVPPEHVLAMWQVVEERGGYGERARDAGESGARDAGAGDGRG